MIQALRLRSSTMNFREWVSTIHGKLQTSTAILSMPAFISMTFRFRVCSSYPKFHIMPRDITDQDIPDMATFRSHNRFPSVVWRSRRTGAVLIRCAQPCVGIMYSRNDIDERFVISVLTNCRACPQAKHPPEGMSSNLVLFLHRIFPL